MLRSKDAKDAKKIGKGVTPLPSWDKIKEEVMHRVIQAKFQQNELLALKLIETAGKTLVEATIDKYWAANATLNSKSVESATWQGANRMGIQLTAVRSALLRERAIEEFPIVDESSTTPAHQATQSKQDSNANVDHSRPTPPARGKRNAKRGNDVLSPAKGPATSYQKVNSPSSSSATNHGLPCVNKSPVKPTVVPPLDLFACPSSLPEDQSTHVNQSTQVYEDPDPTIADDLFACPTKSQLTTRRSISMQDCDHDVYIGSQQI